MRANIHNFKIISTVDNFTDISLAEIKENLYPLLDPANTSYDTLFARFRNSVINFFEIYTGYYLNAYQVKGFLPRPLFYKHLSIAKSNIDENSLQISYIPGETPDCTRVAIESAKYFTHPETDANFLSVEFKENLQLANVDNNIQVEFNTIKTLPLDLKEALIKHILAVFNNRDASCTCGDVLPEDAKSVYRNYMSKNTFNSNSIGFVL